MRSGLATMIAIARAVFAVVIREPERARPSADYFDTAEIHVRQPDVIADPAKIAADDRDWRRPQARPGGREGHMQGGAAEQLDVAPAGVDDPVAGDVADNAECFHRDPVYEITQPQSRKAGHAGRRGHTRGPGRLRYSRLK